MNYQFLLHQLTGSSSTVRVIFPSPGVHHPQTYSYIVNGSTPSQGDYAIAPAGKHNKLTLVQIVETDTHDLSEDLDYPLKHIVAVIPKDSVQNYQDIKDRENAQIATLKSKVEAAKKQQANEQALKDLANIGLDLKDLKTTILSSKVEAAKKSEPQDNTDFDTKTFPEILTDKHL